MALPRPVSPTYILEVPSTKQKVKFRPFLVKEEKILLIAMQEDTEESALAAVRDIITGCTFGELDISKLATYDIDYIFLQLRIKSGGKFQQLSSPACLNEILQERDITVKKPDETIEIRKDQFTGPCGQVTNFSINLEAVTLERNTNHDKKIVLNETLGVIMRPPTLDDAAKMQEIMDSGDVAAIYNAINPFVECITEGETIYKDFTPQELVEFIEMLSDEQFEKIKQYFETMPKLRLPITIVCEKCQHKTDMVLEGLKSFLA